jgi:hypothetical protein
LIFLAYLEGIRNSLTGVLIVFGRVAFFYYIIHIFLIHFIATIAFFLRGHTMAESNNIDGHFPFFFIIPGEGYGLGVVYGIWIGVILILYPVCRWYDNYKSLHRENRFLSYV